jgi:hypothetical protein
MPGDPNAFRQHARTRGQSKFRLTQALKLAGSRFRYAMLMRTRMAAQM